MLVINLNYVVNLCFFLLLSFFCFFFFHYFSLVSISVSNFFFPQVFLREMVAVGHHDISPCAVLFFLFLFVLSLSLSLSLSSIFSLLFLVIIVFKEERKNLTETTVG